MLITGPVTHLFALLLVHHALGGRAFAFVARQHLDHIRRGVLLDVAQPIGQVVVALQVGHVVHEQDAHGTSVVRSGQCPESLLACRVPDLQFYGHAIEVNQLLFEVYAWG